MDATLNVRMGAPLKERGDKVLRENGISASAAVRALWKELASTRTLPPFLQQLKADDAEKNARRQALDEMTGLAVGALSHLSDEELRAVGMERYE